jgi:hypothetical protein
MIFVRKARSGQVPVHVRTFLYSLYQMEGKSARRRLRPDATAVMRFGLPFTRSE